MPPLPRRRLSLLLLFHSALHGLQRRDAISCYAIIDAAMLRYGALPQVYADVITFFAMPVITLLRYAAAAAL